MPTIVFVTRPGMDDLVINMRNRSGESVGSSDNETTEIADGLYTSEVTGTGIVYVIASDGAYQAFGWANLDEAVNGIVEVLDSYEAASKAGDSQVSAIALQVFQRLAGSSVAALAKPTTGKPLDGIFDTDFSLDVTAATTAGNKLVFDVRHCANDESPLLSVDSVSGLVSIKGQNAVTAGDASVVRLSSTLVHVRIRARSLRLIGYGSRIVALREISSTETFERYSATLQLGRSASRQYAP